MSEDRFEAWAIVELFGHQRMAGLVTEQVVGGCSFVRVDAPRSDGEWQTRLLGQGAIYAINFVDEPIAREHAERYRWRPVSVYDMPKLTADLKRSLTPNAIDRDEYFDDDEQD